MEALRRLCIKRSLDFNAVIAEHPGVGPFQIIVALERPSWTPLESARPTEVISDVYCRVCAQPVRVEYRQTRSADEAATAICYCRGCNTRWTL